MLTRIVHFACVSTMVLASTGCHVPANPDAGPQIPDGGDDPDAGPALVCPNVDDNSIFDHPFDRACEEDADCAFVEVQRDCCGTLNAFGVSAAARPELEAWGANCGGLFPGCGCAGQPTFDDLGGSSPTLETVPAIGCLSGICVTSFATVGEPDPECFDVPAAQAHFRRGCVDEADCSIELIYGGCCGELHALGVNAEGAPAAALWSASCTDEAVCDCVPFETTADSGAVGPISGEGAVVDCVENVCTSGYQVP